MLLLRGDGCGGFTPAQSLTLSMAVGGFSDLVTADVNGDGNLDVVLSNPATNRVVIVLGDGQSGLREGSFAAAGSAPGRVLVREVDGDGKPDLIVAAASGITILQGTGDGRFMPLRDIQTGAAVSDVATLDVTGDTRLDIVVAVPEANLVRIYAGDGRGRFTAGQILAGAGPSALVVGDFTGDERPELVIANHTDGSLVRLDSATAFADGQVVASGVRATRLIRADVNGDGRADLVALDATAGELHVLLGNGDGSFERLPLQEIGGAAAGLIVEDINGDQLPDLVISLPGDRQIGVGTNPAPVPLAGDVDRDGIVSEADLRQLIAELFDGDGNDAASDAGGTVDSGVQADANGDAAIKGRNPFEDFTVSGTDMNKIVKAYDPPFSTSTSVYSHIKDNIEDWIETAISIRADYT